MIDTTLIEDNLYPLISTISGIETIISHQSNPRPVTPYVAYEIKELDQLGKGDKGEVQVSGDSDVKSDHELIVKIQVVGPNSRSTASLIKNSFNLSTVCSNFINAGFAYSRSTPIRYVPVMLETDWEDGATFDIVFFISDTMTENVGAIENASVERL